MKTARKVQVHVRWMIQRDMSQVLEIENASFNQPWTEKDFLVCVGERRHVGMVAMHGEKVVGFFIYEQRKTCFDILTIAVHPRWRRRGVGRQMIDKLKSKLVYSRRKALTLAIRERNVAGQLFFRRQRFLATEVTRDFFEGEDAFLMEYTVDE